MKKQFRLAAVSGRCNNKIMGYNPTPQEKEENLKRMLSLADDLKTGQESNDRLVKIDSLKLHPNYKVLIPISGESLVAFTLRYAANLISPPQFEGESYDVECTTLKDGILSLEEEIERVFNSHNGSQQ